MTLVFALAALLLVLISEPSYESRALIMPPLEEGNEGLLSAWMAQLNLPSMIVPMTAGSTTAAVLIDILESRHLSEMVIKGLGLREWYRTESMDEAVRRLQGNSSMWASVTGIITLAVRDRDPWMAARITSRFISDLDSLNSQLQFTRADNTLRFVSGQVERYRVELEKSREKLASFQQDNGIIDFDEQIRGSIEVATALKVKAVLAEIELKLLQEYARGDAAELVRSEVGLENLRRELRKIVEGDSSATVFLPLSRMPGLYQRYASLSKDLEVNERVYSFLLQRYQESGIDKARNTPSVQIVDQPNVPDKRAGFPRGAIVLLAAVIGCLWSSAVLAWWGWMTIKERGEEEEQAFQQVRRIVQNDITALRKRLRL